MNEDLLNSLIIYNKYKRFCFENGLKVEKNKKLESILSSRYNKIGRIRSHFVWLYHNKKYIYFLTFTFSDDNISKCDRTRKDYIKKSLYSFDKDICFILNIDYGKKNERLHYHAIVGTDLSFDLKKHLENTYDDFTYCEPVRFDDSSFKSIPKYLNKLTNHAVKDSTKHSRIIFNFKGYGDLSVPEVRKEYILDKELVGLT